MPSSTASLRILLAEDHTPHPSGASWLEAQGYQVISVDSGLAVLGALHQHPFDAVILPPEVGQMPTLELVRRLTGLFRGRKRPYLVAFSDQNDPATHHQWREAGVDSIVLRPFTEAQLVQALHPLAPSHAPEERYPEQQDQIRAKVHAQLLSLDGDDPEFMLDVLNSFLKTAGALIHDMQQTEDENHSTMTARAAHTMKSSSKLVGLMHLAALCKALEMAAKSGLPSPRLLAYVNKIEEHYGYCLPALEAEKRHLMDRLEQAAA